jgi:hypothetical protein
LKHVIFYSWQSDLDPALTRNFIEEALTRAVKSLNRDDDVFVDAVIDRDTSGVAGTPGIAETIFQKIDQSDVFICDVSIINNTSEEESKPNLFTQLVRVVARVILERTFQYRRIQRPTPNPNVLIELGYAAARIGWEHVILVQNTAYGDLGGLPFDLRSRRIVPFNLSAKESRRDERPKLRDQLESALRKALREMLTPTFWQGKARPRWFGFWHTDGTPTASHTLFIREVSATGFIFHLSLIDGSRAGNVVGFAKFTGPDTAYARIDGADESGPCEIKFRRTHGEKRQIEVEESLGCRHFKGMGASFDGDYLCRGDLLFDSGALDELDLQRLYGITGQYYRPLLDRFQQVGTSENNDTFTAKVITGGAKGLSTLFEAIVMRGADGQLWAAYIDHEVVRYFTTEREFRERLPQTIEMWRGRFRDKNVVFANEIDAIPSV